MIDRTLARPRPHIHAVAVTYRRRDVLEATLDTVLGQTRPPDSVVVVDNGREDEVRDLVEGRAGVSYMAMSDNVGPAGAIAAAMEVLMDTAAPDDWLLLIDDDDPPPFDTAVEEALEVALRAPGDVGAVGLTGPRYGRWTGRLQRIPDDELQEMSDVDYVGNGFVPLYRVEAIRDVGVFDPGLFIFFEELDYGLRLRRAGWRIVIARDLVLRVRAASGRLGLGRHARSERRVAPWRAYYAARNEVLVARRHGAWTAPYVVTARLVAGGVAKALAQRSTTVLTARSRGVRDGWRGRTGRTLDV